MAKICDLTPAQALIELKSCEGGLSDEEAQKRKKTYGENAIQKKKRGSLLTLFLGQFKDVMTLLLIASAAISAFVAYFSKDSSSLCDTLIIAIIILLNGVAGTVQQFRADRAIENLKKLSADNAKVVRGGVKKVIAAKDVTVGDIVCLEEGDLIPADLRIITCANLLCDEAALTGESQGVEKSENVAGGGEASNLLYKGTYVLRGNAQAVAYGIGRNTQIGAIADMLEDEEKNKTPLEKTLDKLGKIISLFVLGVAAIIFIMGIFVRGDGILKTFMTAIAVAVAAIPEGLPAVVTIIMAMGVQRMSGENVVIRKLKCVETLGGCTCICTDKTGTLTQNKMKVVKAFASFKELSLGDTTGVNCILKECAALCTTVAGDNGRYIGDPTEVALKYYSLGAKIREGALIALNPFTSERKMMSGLFEFFEDGGELLPAGKRLYVKGAPDVLLKGCTNIIDGGEVRQITEHDKKIILAKNDEMSDCALRVLAFAYRDGNNLDESDLTFIGLCGMIDGLKEGVKSAVAECKRAGITTVMITGDHARTAYAIARQAGIVSDMSRVFTGEQLDSMNKAEKTKAIASGLVFARVTPKHKNLIVKIKKKCGEVVAMTGDGVNDAPPIKSADIGIAMGICGTDVTKGAADMVIADDNFTTIVTAVREGRRISANVKKTIQFFLSTNLAEVFCLLIAATLFFKYDFLYSTQLLWINLITDSFPVIALGVEMGESNVMSHPPQRAEKALFSKSSIFIIAVSGLYITGVTIFVYIFSLFVWGNSVATTITFLTISFLELFQAFNIRTERTSNFAKGAFSNKVLIVTVVLGIAVNVALLLSPLAELFSLVKLNGWQWLLAAVASLSVLPFGELYKFVLRHAHKRKKVKANKINTKLVKTLEKNI